MSKTIGKIMQATPPEFWGGIDKCESPIEEHFKKEWDKWIEGAEIEPQVSFLGGKYRVDFVLRHPNGVIAIECDGADYHDSWKDEKRDLELIRSGEVAKFFRFAGRLLFNAPELAVAEVVKDHPSLFTERDKMVASRKVATCGYRMAMNDILKRRRR